ncbi:MAG: PmoA family protein [Planctomycetaceae bacterium]|nr:PmoA family protein [Planctomycetales bacterium]MCB9938178.1 PmoA family protein [Planctomycetaceae bacterium]
MTFFRVECLRASSPNFAAISCCAWLLLVGNANALGEAGTRSGASEFSVTADDNSLEIELGDRSIATYYFRHKEVARPFFAHVRTPSGIQVTRNFPPVEGTDPTDHPTMHPGIWLAFANINGVNFWHNNDGKVLHDGFETEPTSGGRPRFATRERYVDATGKDVCRSVTRYEIAKAPSGWTLSIDTSLQSEDDLVFAVKEEMGLGTRVATAISVKAGSGSILNASGGRDEKGTWGKHDRWWDYSGAFNNRHVGILLVSAHSNPSIWSHSRDYGLLVANPFPVDSEENRGKSTVIKGGVEFRLRFSLLIYETRLGESLDRDAIYEKYGRAED